jgi:hypothetical protein
MYDQRMNGRLKGALDFWLDTGPALRIDENWALEAVLRHLCRHETSLDNPVILDVNEAVGLVRYHQEGFELGLGFGGYVGKTRDFRNLAVFSLSIPDFIATGISLESEVKWVNFEEWLYETGFSVALGRGASLFIRGARTYRFPAAAYLGVRFDSGGTAGRPLESFRADVGTITFDDRYKLAASGLFRLELYRDAGSRFLADVGFRGPVLDGRSFFAEFRPDRFIYDVCGEYERAVGRFLFVSWYADYRQDMPLDKAVPFSGSLGTGLKIKNQRDFEKLERCFRFDVSGGWNFKYDQEVAIRAGANSLSRKGVRFGADLGLKLSGRLKSEIDVRVFADTGRSVSLRPYIGLKNRASFGGIGPPGRFKLVVGVGMYRWL